MVVRLHKENIHHCEKKRGIKWMEAGVEKRKKMRHISRGSPFVSCHLSFFYSSYSSVVCELKKSYVEADENVSKLILADSFD